MHDDALNLEAIIRPVVEGLGCILWGFEYRTQKNSALLRIFIDKDEGVSMDDCSKVSNQVSGVLDVEDPIPVAYTLEVSSPGLDRVLFYPDQYEKYIGEVVKLRLKWPVEDRRNYLGKILSVDNDGVEVDQDGTTVKVPYEAVHRARLSGQN
jgi:ribosome maturation factor RimP